MEIPVPLSELQPQIVGQQVTDRQLAANSLSIWIATAAGEAVGYTIWLEPSWHVLGPAGIIAGSRQAQDEEEPSGWAAVSDAIDQLVGRRVEALEVDARTGDLTVRLSGGYLARTFVSDPRDSRHWWITDRAGTRRVVGSPVTAGPATAT